MNQFNNLNINQQDQMIADPDLNYELSLFEGKINPGYQQGIGIYLQETKDIENEYDKLDISF